MRARAAAGLLVPLAVLPGLAVGHGTVAAATLPEGTRTELFFRDPAIAESSGLVVRGDDVLTVNDSGDGPVVYVVDARTGATVGRTTYSDRGVADVEALAPGSGGTLWVADIGDNARARDSVSLYRLPPVERGDRTVDAERFDLVYPGGPRDAETLLVDPTSDRVLIVTKGVFGGEVLAAPEPLRPGQPNRLRRVGSVDGLVTDGTFLPGGRSVVLRDYGRGHVVDPETWRARGSFRLPRQRQGEAVAPWSGRGGRDGRSGGRAEEVRVLISSEGRLGPLYSVPVPRRLLSPPRDEAPSGSVGTTSSSGDADDLADESTETTADAGDGIPVGAAVVGGAVLVVLSLGAFWLFRRRVRRSASSR